MAVIEYLEFDTPPLPLGPELLHMGGNSGTVIPNNRLASLGGGASSMKVEVNNYAGARVQPREQVDTMPDGTQLRLIIDVFADDFANGGLSAAVVKNRFGLRDAV